MPRRKKRPPKAERRERVKRGIRRKISGTPSRPRLSVYRSNTHIYAQLVDDRQGHTLVAASSLEDGVEEGEKPMAVSRVVGERLAERAKEAGIESVVFDRNAYRYHGRVKALTEGARAGGLQF